MGLKALSLKRGRKEKGNSVENKRKLWSIEIFQIVRKLYRKYLKTKGKLA